MWAPAGQRQSLLGAKQGKAMLLLGWVCRAAHAQKAQKQTTLERIQEEEKADCRKKSECGEHYAVIGTVEAPLQEHINTEPPKETREKEIANLTN